MEENNDFDEQIKKTLHLIAGRRKEKKITQTEMGNVLGLTLNSYRKIELGTSQMKMKTLLQLSKSLDLNFFKEDFLTESIVSDRKEMQDIIVNNEIKYSKELMKLKRENEELKSKNILKGIKNEYMETLTSNINIENIKNDLIDFICKEMNINERQFQLQSIHEKMYQIIKDKLKTTDNIH